MPPAMKAAPRPRPSVGEEEALWARGLRFVAGIDEVGRGPLAGPIVAAAVVLDPDRLPGWVGDVRDSKQLPAGERERLATAIQSEALAFGLGSASVTEIDVWGIAPANRVAMSRAITALRLQPHFVLVDGRSRLCIPQPQRTIIDGDALCVSIAAASIVAKVARDSLMRDLDGLYPGYGFASNKGYGTPRHLASLAACGPSEQHRRSFEPVRRATQATEVARRATVRKMLVGDAEG